VHSNVDLKVLYFGTPVVLISSQNEDGSPNLAPMSSAWWLGQSAMLGLGNSGQTTINLRRERECVLNLAPSSMVDAVDRLAMLTAAQELPPHKAKMGYRSERDKFGAAGLTPQPAQLVRAPRVLECPIQLECTVTAIHDLGSLSASAIEVQVARAHVHDDVRLPGTNYIDPIKWDPLIMKFCEFFGNGEQTHPSRLAAGWNMPHAALVH
jgi:flavin reductase (DIM6/NTAB) family NADH-FMN oxidoreductase RutF